MNCTANLRVSRNIYMSPCGKIARTLRDRLKLKQTGQNLIWCVLLDFFLLTDRTNRQNKRETGGGASHQMAGLANLRHPRRPAIGFFPALPPYTFNNSAIAFWLIKKRKNQLRRNWHDFNFCWTRSYQQAKGRSTFSKLICQVSLEINLSGNYLVQMLENQTKMVIHGSIWQILFVTYGNLIIKNLG